MKVLTFHRVILSVFWLSFYGCFQVVRDQTGDEIYGEGISDYCSTLTACKCGFGKTLLSELPTTCASEVSECLLRAEGDNSAVHLLEGNPGDFYEFNIVSESSTSVCATAFPLTIPIFVRDFQNTIMMWNPRWNEEFNKRIKAEIVGSKVRLKIRSHWGGLLLKIYVDCGMGTQCLAIKFKGSVELPLGEVFMESFLGPVFPVPSSLVPFSKSTVTSALIISSTTILSPLTTTTVKLPLTTTFVRLPLTTTKMLSKTKTPVPTIPTTYAKTTTNTRSSLSTATKIQSSEQNSILTTHSYTISKTTTLTTLKAFTTSSTPTFALQGSSTIMTKLNSSQNINPATTISMTQPSTTVVINTVVGFGKLGASDDWSWVWYLLLGILILCLFIWLCCLVWYCKKLKRSKFSTKREDQQKIIGSDYKGMTNLSNQGSLNSSPAILNTQNESNRDKDGSHYNNSFVYDVTDGRIASHSMDEVFLDIRPVTRSNPLTLDCQFPDILDEEETAIHELEVQYENEAQDESLDTERSVDSDVEGAIIRSVPETHIIYQEDFNQSETESQFGFPWTEFPDSDTHIKFVRDDSLEEDFHDSPLNSRLQYPHLNSSNEYPKYKNSRENHPHNHREQQGTLTKQQHSSGSLREPGLNGLMPILSKPDALNRRYKKRGNNKRVTIYDLAGSPKTYVTNNNN